MLPTIALLRCEVFERVQERLRGLVLGRSTLGAKLLEPEAYFKVMEAEAKEAKL